MGLTEFITGVNGPDVGVDVGAIVAVGLPWVGNGVGVPPEGVGIPVPKSTILASFVSPVPRSTVVEPFNTVAPLWLSPITFIFVEGIPGRL